MAELILTDKEKKDASYLDWGNEALGKLVKQLGVLLKDKYGQDSAWMTMAAHLLVDLSRRTNSTDTTLSVKGCTKNDESIGDWVIKKVCQDYKQNKDKLKNIAINISSKQFNQDNFVTNLLKTTKRYGVDPSVLKRGRGKYCSHSCAIIARRRNAKPEKTQPELIFDKICKKYLIRLSLIF